MQCNQSTSAFSKICVSRFPERLNSKVEIYPNFCPSSIVPVAIALAIEVLRKLPPGLLTSALPRAARTLGELHLGFQWYEPDLQEKEIFQKFQKEVVQEIPQNTLVKN